MATLDRAAFERLLHRYADDLHRYALWLAADPEIAADVVQECMLRAWRGRKSLQSEGAAKSWLITILRREHARLYERKRLEMADIDLGFLPDEDLPSQTDREQLREVRQAMFALAPKYREPLLLQTLMGMSVEEIATTLALSKTAVMSQLFRARNQIRDELNPDDG